jgi:hypothetical protein
LENSKLLTHVSSQKLKKHEQNKTKANRRKRTNEAGKNEIQVRILLII